MQNRSRSALVRALPLGLALVASPAFALGDAVLWYTGNSGYTTTGYTSLEEALTGAGATSFDETSTWPDDLSAYRLVFLVKSAHLYYEYHITDIEAFLADGGTLVMLADSAGGSVGAITTFNRLAEDLSLTTVFVEDELDDSCDSVGTVAATHAFTTCMGDIVYSKSSDITVGSGGEALVTGESSQTLVAVEGSVVFISDLAIFYDTCSPGSSNFNLARNMYRGLSGSVTDDDCDGYTPESEGGTDCNDDDATVYPSADDICDDLDNDCDGETDEDTSFGSTYYIDKDDDNYGTSGDTVVACEAPEGYADNRTDCNDYDATVYPDAPEICDETDNDCDGTDDEDPVDGTTWYADQDGDGYGGLDYTEEACTQPDAFIADGSDCDDTKVQVHPGATEYCNDLDDDCDEVVDNDATNTKTFYADADGDGYGDESVTTEACDAPTGYVSNANDCTDSDATIYPSAEGWSAECEQVGDTAGEDTAGGADKGTGCGCSTSANSGFSVGWLVMLGLAGLWRRRRSDGGSRVG